jgi:HlyD family secretion protein
MSAPTNPFAAPAAPVAPAAPQKKKSRKLFIIVSLLGFVVLVAVVFAATRKKETGIPVTTEKAVVKTITHLVTATGKVQPEVEVKISPEVTGEIVELPFLEGQAVKKGDLIVRIKPDLYQAQVEQQEASLVSTRAASVLSEARRIKAEQDFKQAQELHAKQLLSEADFTAARTNLNVAKADYDSSLAQIRRAEGSLTQAKDSLAKTIIYSPIDGQISSLSNEVGERVAGTGSFGGAEIMRIADLGNMEVRVKVNENDIVNVKLGDPVSVAVDAYPGRKFAGAVNEISSSAITTGAQSAAATASDEVTNFLVKIRIKDKDAKLRPGMSATVDIETETVTNVVSVPIQSVTVRAAGGKTAEELQAAKAKEAKERSGNDLEVVNEKDDARRNRDNLQRVVFIKSGDTVKQRNVETGLADNSSIEIKNGVKAGEEVVSGSYAAISRRLKDGSKVMVEKAKKEEAAK